MVQSAIGGAIYGGGVGGIAKGLGSWFTRKVLPKNIISASEETEKKDFISWVVDTLNPINHIPIISTLNNFNKDEKSSLDMIQSAIGGIIYGGGAVGVAKGLGGWFTRKLLTKDIITANSKSEKNKEVTLINNGKVTNNNNLKKVSFKTITSQEKIMTNNDLNEFNTNIVKDSNKINITNIKKSNKDYYDLNNKSKKTITKAIDIKA